MNKKIVVLLVVFTLTVLGLSAQSWGGRGSWGGGRGWGWGSSNYNSNQAEETVTGVLSINNGIATLGDYSLIIPGQVVLQNGDTVEAKGFVNGSNLMVTWLKVNGNEYLLGNSGYGGWGGRRGGGYGGYGWCW